MELQKQLVDSLSETLPMDPLIGQVLAGKYELISSLGNGSMGKVYLARRILLGNNVAVKILRPEYVSNPVIVKRFHREACAAARIDDPRVVKILDYYDMRKEGLVFLVMELIEGSTLGALLDREAALTPERAIALMLEICGGVGAAHEQGIVHRDLKPSNIMLPERNEQKTYETVKIVDFGLCKLSVLPAEQILTQPGVMMGTPYYMSPEQCRGQALDVRSDVYSLGAIMYEMLTGTPPFTAGSTLEVFIKHLHEEPVPLVAQVSINHKLNSVIMRALAKDPKARQADAKELSDELEQSIEPDALNPQRRWWQRILHQLAVLI